MKVVIDTNVLVSAVIRGREPRAIIEFSVDNPEFMWIISTEIVTEYKEVLSRKKLKLTDEIKAEWFEIIDTFPSFIVASLPIPKNDNLSIKIVKHPCRDISVFPYFPLPNHLQARK